MNQKPPQVEIIRKSSHVDLQEAINKWLTENDFVTIIDIKYTHTEYPDWRIITFMAYIHYR